MDKEKVLKKLNDLIQLDIDAIHAYDQALDHIDSETIALRLAEFKRDHQQHVDDLSAEVKSLGGMPPDFSKDFKGFLIEGFTAVRSMTGTEGALKAMRANEKTTNKKYEKALSLNMPASTRQIVEKNREDERRHLDYIEDVIQQQLWKQAG